MTRGLVGALAPTFFEGLGDGVGVDEFGFEPGAGSVGLGFAQEALHGADGNAFALGDFLGDGVFHC